MPKKGAYWMRLDYDESWRTMYRFERKLEDQSLDALDATLEAIVNDIRSSWSPTAPGSPGSPPAVVTGNLDSSVLIDEQGRDLAGRFAGKDAMVRFLRVDTTEGINPMDRGNYAPILEGSHPFIEPALDRHEGTLTANIKRFVKL